MTITYLAENPSAADHRQLLKTAHPNWSKDHQERVLAAFAKSDFTVAAYAGKLLVGTVRVFSDTVGFAIVADLLVHPKYRRQGIATTLLTMCQKTYAGFYLYADPQTSTISALYTKNGFRKRSVYRYIKP